MGMKINDNYIFYLLYFCLDNNYYIQYRNEDLMHCTMVLLFTENYE